MEHNNRMKPRQKKPSQKITGLNQETLEILIMTVFSRLLEESKKLSLPKVEKILPQFQLSQILKTDYQAWLVKQL